MLYLTYKTIIKNYIKAYNSFDIKGMLSDLDSTIEFENQVDGRITLKITGIREFEEQAIRAKNYFMRRQMKVTGWHFENNVITVDVIFEGILAVDSLDDPKMGEILKIKGISEFTFFGEKIIQIVEKS